MGSGSDLLRMLEPAMRPASTTGATGPSAASKSRLHLPIEGRSFDSLLEEARQMNLTGDAATPSIESATAGTPASTPASAPNLLATLAQLDRIENPALRTMLSAPSNQTLNGTAH